jgi:hypothetical protein
MRKLPRRAERQASGAPRLELGASTATTLLLDRAREETGGGGHGDSRNRKANLGGAFKDS